MRTLDDKLSRGYCPKSTIVHLDLKIDYRLVGNIIVN